jgi:hypothetical protein
MTSVRALARTPLPRGLSVALCGLVLAAVVLVARAAAVLAPATPHPARVTAAATLDLTVTASVVTWWWLRRDFGWSVRALAAIFLTAVALAGLVLPAGREGPLHVLDLAAAPLELGLLAYLARRVVVARRRARADARAGGRAPDVQDTIAAAAAAVVGRGRFAELLSYEMAVLYYALAPRGGGSSGGEALEPPIFTYHRKSAYGAIVFVLLLATLAEVPAAHFLVRQWSGRAAWLLTALGLYGALWIVGDWRACRARPIRLEDGVLRVRLGLRWRLDIPLGNIRAIRAPTAADKARGAVDLRLTLPGASWTLLELDRRLEAIGPYGLRREVRIVGLGLDEPERLRTLLGARGEGATH